ncbi:hypothetical protein [Streptosporangium sp. NPDC002524]
MTEVQQESVGLLVGQQERRVLILRREHTLRVQDGRGAAFCGLNM